jgi:glycosyltransferase involved in cell wall biosynthesis
MRVCHIWHNFYPLEFGGVERYILSLSNYLAKTDPKNEFLLVTDKAAYVPLSRSIQIPRFERISSLEVYRLSPNFSSLLRGTLIKTPIHSQELDQKLAFNLFRQALKAPGIDRVDIYHIHGLWKPLYPTIGLQLSKYFKKPFIVTLHGDSVNPNDPYSMPLKSPPMANILKQASAITTFAKESYQILSEIGLAEKSQLIPNFVHTKAFRRPVSKTETQTNRLLMVSRLSRAKDPLTPIRAFPEILKEVPDATFKIVGYGSLYQKAKDLVEELGIQQSVTLLGMKSNVKEDLWNSDIFIANRGGYMSTLEAWSAGLAVVAPRFGIMNDLISDNENGKLVEPGNPSKLAEAVISLMTNKEDLARIAKNGVATANTLDISNISRRLEETYKKAIDNYHG